MDPRSSLAFESGCQETCHTPHVEPEDQPGFVVRQLLENQMSESARSEGREFARFLESMPEAERVDLYNKQVEKDKRQYQEFAAAFSNGHCYLCDKPLPTFSTKSPCLHGLLKPKGFEKGCIRLIADKFGIFQIQAYLRWVATQDAPVRNINDLSEDGGKNLIALTIRYKQLEWSFSCSESDFLGHQGSNFGKEPHYHFQMRIDGRPYINYSDFHLPLTRFDVVHIEAKRVHGDKLVYKFPFGEGIGDFLKDENVETILKHSKMSYDPDLERDGTSPFRIQSLVMAEDGGTISGDDIHNLMQEAREKGVTVASLLHKLPNATTQVIVSPGPGVVDPAPRKGGRGKGAS